MTKISIVIPIYNSEKYLADCLDSVLRQTFKEYEVVCVDDGSKDSSKKIAESYAKKFKAFRIIFHHKNRGLSAARNTGLRNSEGKYVFFLDSDDMIMPETLEELYQCAEKNNLDEIYFNMRKIYDSEMKHIQDKRTLKYRDYEDIYNGQEMFSNFAVEKNLKIEAWRQFYRKDFLQKNEIWFYEGILHEDNLFSFLCAMKAQRVMNINKEYYIYRQHGGSIMSTMNQQRMQSIYIVLLEIFKYWSDNDFSNSVNCAILFYFEHLFSTFLYYKNICQNNENMEIGNYAERSLYKLLTGNYVQKKYASLSKDKISRLRETKYVIVFGAGRAAIDVIEILQREKININAVAVNNVEVSSKIICGLAVIEIKELLEYRNAATVIVGVTDKYCKEVSDQLTDMGFKHLMLIDECD